jgi:hypothetical protein
MSETQQSTDAAQRSAHVTRDGPPDTYVATCFFCGGPWKKGGASYAAKASVLVPGSTRAIVEACSAECAAHL